MVTTKPKPKYRLTSARDGMTGAERLMVENVIAWRIIAAFAMNIAFCSWLEGGFVDLGLSVVEAQVAVFLTLNVALFGACVRSWRRSVFPLAPRGWRRGPRARIAILVMVGQVSLMAFLPLSLKLAMAFGSAWYALNFRGSTH